MSCFLLLAISGLMGCAGFVMQTRADLPFDTISIGIIENKTVEPGLQDRFNRVLADTLAEYGFRLCPLSRYILEGEITAFNLKPVAERLLVATRYEIIIKATFRLIDRETGKSVPLVAESPFVASFSSVGKLERVIIQKELSTETALRNLSRELTRRITFM
ncbi:LPS assembly lipoprotein LptE [Thermodesulfovibrionales bacterium]|nr:LPS assembly lipoprotein LptE [Thermodesulfovibrionales bacterium]MCL0040212.1 LPS assembly lipoprotein LptE [Thermodesulfovibrionales bacterium]MCL0047326.1 LPS assembly lipoprotein LptE [Thermodesulfovibrionales bacterium]MCL0062198.1 LPS assembly lipoprotein LptE [Thermodesulfovibrionales bacterium]MCL0068173.1 LPS assembly lipoprotein LptE [Thermodesulfovibrionales bacterium]